MKNRGNLNKIFLLFTTIMLIFSGCSTDDILGSADRLFRPVISESNITEGGNWVKVKWDKYSDVSYCELALSTDSFKTVYMSTKTQDTAYTFKNVDYDTKYQIRIRSIGNRLLESGDTIKSEYNNYSVTTSDIVTFLSAPTSSDVIDNAIRVKWTVSSSLAYTRIDVMLGKDSVYKSVTLSDADNTAGLKIISGLEPSTTYIAKIYSADGYKGKKTFKTESAQVFDGDVVDLRDYSDDLAPSLLTQEFIDSLSTAHPNGFNMILAGGLTYAVPTINISVPMNIVTGLSFNGKANMAINGGFSIAANATVSTLTVNKIFFTQGTISGKYKTDANYGGAYLFNLNLAGGNLDTLNIKNCDIKYKRGVVRMQTTATISTINIDNCVLDSIGGYGVVNNANDGSYIGDIVVSNTTIAHAEKVFTCGKAKGINSITMSYVTTCYTPGYVYGGTHSTTSYFFDYNGNSIPGGIQASNCLFGVCGGSTTHGIRTASGVSTTFTNCYKTSDLVWTVNATTLLSQYPIDALTDYGKTSSVIFTNPTASDFTLTTSASSLNDKVGDSRWWY